MKTDDQLRALLAKMLPETVHFSHSGELCWSHNYNQDSHLFVRVLDTELLHLCSLAEAGLTVVESCKYFDLLRDLEPDGEAAGAFAYHATWQQRTRALAEVKGVTL